MIRWGFLGAGWIASTALAPAVATASNSLLYAVASRDEQRSRSLNPLKVHRSYDDLLADSEVDAIYISLANHQHCEWTIKALNAGKHVLCEKPLAMNHIEAQEMAAAATANNRILVEAVWARWHPRFARAVELIKSGAIGKLRSIDSSFTFTASLADNYRLRPEMGGGSWLDVGPYQVHAWAAFTDAISSIKIDALNQNLSASGVDLTTRISAHINDSISVTALSSFELAEQQTLKIIGDTGSIEFPGGQSFTSWNQASSLRIGNTYEEFAPVDPYALMIESFARKLQSEEAWLVSLRDSIAVMRALDAFSAPENPERNSHNNHGETKE